MSVEKSFARVCENALCHDDRIIFERLKRHEVNTNFHEKGNPLNTILSLSLSRSTDAARYKRETP